MWKKNHTPGFLQLACYMDFPGRSLCNFYYTSLNAETKARLPSVGPLGNFTEFVEWMLVNDGSTFTIFPAENYTNPTPDPEPRQKSPHCTDMTAEPTADGELEHAAMHEPAPVKRTKPNIALELKCHEKSDQVRVNIMRVLVEYEGMGARAGSASLWLYLGTQSHQLHLSSRHFLWLHLGRSALWIHCRLQDHQCRPVPFALHPSSPWCQEPSLHHGSSLPQLHCRLSS